MSLEIAIQVAKSKGRGNDSMLVHMTPGEVQALQGIAQAHGGSLTTNPDTGLPEAGFLENILPAVAGIGLSVVSGGTLSPLMAGLITGGATGLITGSMEKGLMAGLGAFGGAGLGAGLMGAGAAAAGNAATAGLSAAGTLPAAQAAGAGAAAATGATTAVPSLAGLTAAPGAALGSLGTTLPAGASMGANLLPAAGQGLGSLGAAMPNTAFQAAVQPQAASGALSSMGRGLQQLATAPNQPLNVFGDTAFDMVGGWKGVGQAGLAAAAPMLMGSGEQEQAVTSPVSEGNIQTYDFTRTPRANRKPGERYFDSNFTKTGTYAAKDFQGYAEGGLADAQDMIRIEAPPELQRTTFSQERLATPDASGRKFNQSYGIATLTPEDRAMGLVPDVTGFDALDKWASQLPEGVDPKSLDFSKGYAMVPRPRTNTEGGYQGYAQGGQPRHLKGPGDGLSDSIPAVVDGVQPAALATDEFVVPADVVSQLGNGSSDAGARKLYAMMDRIRQQAHGKKRQQRPVDESKVMPA